MALIWEWTVIVTLGLSVGIWAAMLWHVMPRWADVRDWWAWLQRNPEQERQRLDNVIKMAERRPR